LYWDWTMIVLLPAILVSLIAQMRVNSTFHKYQAVAAQSRVTASQVARQMLDMNGLGNVRIERVHGHLSDHYDPRSKVLRLSESTYNSPSVAALGVAAHECGHAMQDAERYAPLRIRNSMVPVANFGSSASWILLLLGLFMGFPSLMYLGILVFTAVVAFQLVTLPVEFNASNRALAALEGGGFLTREEVGMSAKVLRAAALTYVAAALTAVLQLLRLLLIARRHD